MKALMRMIRPGMRVLLGDGLGLPLAALRELPPEISLVLGWFPRPEPSLDFSAFSDVRALMSGWGLRKPIDAGHIHAVQARLRAVPALLSGPLRPDLLVISVIEVPGGFALSTEVNWLPFVLELGVPVAAVLRRGPNAADMPPIPADRVTVVDRSEQTPMTISFSEPSQAQRAIGDRVAALIPEGARVHVGIGALGQAVLEAIKVPVQIDTGLLGDAVVALDRRALLLGTPTATYLGGGAELLDWSDGRRVLRRIEHTHDLTRMSTGTPLFSVNTAIEIDQQGQINVEGTARSLVGGIGGHPDYSAAATLSVDGMSIVAVEASHGDTSTLVETLSRPVSTPSHDVDMIVTDRGHADLRGLDRSERVEALERLWS